MLPTFIVIGAMKAGTTALYGYLAEHPDVFMATPKELDFFVDSGTWRLGMEWYEQKFADAGSARARGEASPNYSKVHLIPKPAERIAAAIPQARLIYVVRHPIERMRSMYLHQVADGRERRSIDEALATNRDYLRTSSYGFQVAAYLRWFPRDQLLLLKSEDLRADRQAALHRVFDFIGVDPSFVPAGIAEEPNQAALRRFPNAAGAALLRFPPYQQRVAQSWRVRELHNKLLTTAHDPAAAAISPEVEAQLRDALAPDLDRLGKWMPADFDRWGLD